MCKFGSSHSLCNGTNKDEHKVSKWVDNWDGLEGKSANCDRTIVLIRHGQYAYGDHDDTRFLTPLGRQQAVETGKRLNELIVHKYIPPIDKIYFSTMKRAVETHDLILTQLDVLKPLSDADLVTSGNMVLNSAVKSIPCDLIREGAVCEPDPPHATWQPSKKEFEHDQKRVEEAFKKYFHRPLVTGGDTPVPMSPSTTLFVCHGNVIRYFVMRALQLPPGIILYVIILLLIIYIKYYRSLVENILEQCIYNNHKDSWLW